jgi:hypothetical protein
MGPDRLTGANPQKLSSAGSDAEPSQIFYGHLDPPPVEPDSFGLAIASSAEDVDQKTGAGDSSRWSTSTRSKRWKNGW